MIINRRNLTAGRRLVGWQNDELLRAFDFDQLLYLPLSVEQGCLGILAIGTTFAHER